MNGTTNWQPSQYDLDWTRANVIERRDLDGKIPLHTAWCVPANRSIYWIDRTDKTALLLDGPEMTSKGNLLEQLRVILPHFGYHIIPRPPGIRLPPEMRQRIWQTAAPLPGFEAEAAAERVKIIREIDENLFGKGKSRPTNPE